MYKGDEEVVLPLQPNYKPGLIVSKVSFHSNSNHKQRSTFNYNTLSIEFEIQNISILFRYNFSQNFGKWARHFWPSGY